MKIKSIGSLIANNVSYVLTDCQHKLDDSIQNDTNWIQLHKVFQNLKGKHIATILGVLDQNKDVVIKIQPFEESKKEYEFHNVLKNEPGFIEFYFFVTCGSPIQYIEQYGFQNSKPEQKLCSKKGNTLGIIVSPYYKNGSLEYFLQKYSKTDKLQKLKTILALVLASYYYAYKKYKFVHGDFYSKNILLDDNYFPLIIDFEKSSFNHTSNIRLFWVDIQNLLDDVYRFVNNSKFNEIIRTHIVLNMAYNKAPTTSIIRALQKDILDL